MTYNNQPSFSKPRLLVPDHFSCDVIRFGQAFPPEKRRELTRLAPGVYMRYGSLADQDACVAALCDASDRTVVLVVDTDRYERETQIHFDLPRATAYFAAAAPGSVIKCKFQMVGQRLTSGASQKSLSGLSLLELHGTADPVMHRILKKLPLQDVQSKIKNGCEILRSPFHPDRLELSITVSPKSGSFSISTVSLKIGEVSPPNNCKVLQVGSRIQGAFPHSHSDSTLTVYADGSIVDVPIESSSGFFVLRTEGALQFDINGPQLKSLLPSLESSAVFVGLKLNGKLVAGAECDIPIGSDDGSVDRGHPLAQSNSDILAAAKSYFRDGRSNAGLTILARLVDSDLEQQRTAVQLGVPELVKERRFEEAISLFESTHPPLIDDARAYPSYVEACVSSGYVQKAKAELQSLALRTGKSTPKMLAKLYRFASLLDDQYRSLFRERLLSVACDLRPFTKSILHLGHDFVARRDWRGFSQTAAALARFDLKNSEKASVALLMAQVAHILGNTSQFVECLNEAMRRLQVTPISLVNADLGFSLSNLRAHSDHVNSDSPLVSVLMTSFNSQDTIRYAVNSVLEQSYRNLELIIVDDCSNDRTQAIISDLASADERIVPIFAPSNAGTYSCKNLGLDRARGEFITCHDSDDWAHPQKIEASVARLSSARTLVATGTQVVRFSKKDGLQFRRDYIQRDAPSLMYRAEPVRRSLGYYDSVRAAGDTEFETRMKRAFGARAVHRGQDLLTIAAWSESTLTGGGPFAIDNDTALLGRVRDEYRRRYGSWHERSDRLYIDYPLRERPFSAPEELLAAAFIV